MTVFAFDNYKEYVNKHIENLPRGGRGEYQRLSQVLQMHSTTVSHVFKGEKDLTLDQAAKLCEHWALSPQEGDYFLTLVELKRSGSPELKKILLQRLHSLKQEVKELQRRIPKDYVLSEAERTQFYSEWYYSAIRLLCDCPHSKTSEAIAQKTKLPITKVIEVLKFLVSCGLVEFVEGEYKLGPQRTFLDASSPLVNRHHANWRLKALETHPLMQHDLDFALTSPMTISHENAYRIREILLKATEEVLKINKDSESESLHVLNIDWLKL